jgi:hypothetical protein
MKTANPLLFPFGFFERYSRLEDHSLFPQDRSEQEEREKT